MSEPANTELDLTPKECTLIEQMHRAIANGSHYTLLGVPEDAETKQVRQAYYDLSRHWHPDRFFRREVGEYAPKIEAIFSAITRAYQTLSNDRKRDQYDQERMAKQSSQGRVSSRRRRRRSTRKPKVDIIDTPIEALADDAEDDESSEDPTLEGEGEDEGDAPVEAAPSRPRKRVRRRASRMTPRARTKYRKQLMGKVRKDVVENIRRATIYYDAGKKDLEDGQPLKAESSLYLAVKLAPQNQVYRDLLNEAHEQSLQIRAQQFMNAAESAESFQNIQEAMYNYRKAVEYKSQNGLVYYRLAQLIRRFEKDTREALKHLRVAVQCTPDNADFRIALAEVYNELDLGLNARREYQEAGKHARDKATKERIKEGMRSIR